MPSFANSVHVYVFARFAGRLDPVQVAFEYINT